MYSFLSLPIPCPPWAIIIGTWLCCPSLPSRARCSIYSLTIYKLTEFCGYGPAKKIGSLSFHTCLITCLLYETAIVVISKRYTQPASGDKSSVLIIYLGLLQLLLLFYIWIHCYCWEIQTIGNICRGIFSPFEYSLKQSNLHLIGRSKAMLLMNATLIACTASVKQFHCICTQWHVCICPQSWK